MRAPRAACWSGSQREQRQVLRTKPRVLWVRLTWPIEEHRHWQWLRKAAERAQPFLSLTTEVSLTLMMPP